MNSDLQVETIRSALNTADQSKRRQTLMELNAGINPEVISLIGIYLGDPYPAVCEAAVEALSRCENSTAAEAAAIHLRSCEPSERGYALQALIRLGSHSLPCLARLLGDSDSNIRKFATDAMASIHAPECLPMLCKTLASNDPLVAAAAADALGTFSNPEIIPILGAVVERGPNWVRVSALASLGKIGGKAAAEWICRIPPDAPEYVQAVAVNAISRAVERGTNSAYTFLASLLKTKNQALEEEIVKTLGHWIANERLSTAEKTDLHHIAVPFHSAIDSGLHSLEPLVRAAAVTCFYAVEDFDKSRISRMLEDHVGGVRLAALNTLALHSEMTFEELARIALDQHEEDTIRVTALHFLAKIIQYKAPIDGLILASLIRLVNSTYEPSIRAAAMRALLLSGDAAGDDCVIAQLTEEEFANEDAVLLELMDCPVDILLPIAHKGMKDADQDVRRHIFTMLICPERAHEFTRILDGQSLIIAALSDGDWRIRVHAISILGKCADQTWPRKLLRNACESLDDRVRVRAVDALGACQESRDEVEIFRAHLCDTSERVRTAAFQALGYINLLVKEELRQALLDPYPPMQQAALVALLSSDQYLKSQPLWSLAEQISSQSMDPEMNELGIELGRRLTQC